MATAKKKISDFFSPFSNPGGGVPPGNPLSAFMAATKAPPVSPFMQSSPAVSPFQNRAPVSPLISRPVTPPNTGSGTFGAPMSVGTPTLPPKPAAPVAPAAPAAPVFSSTAGAINFPTPPAAGGSADTGTNSTVPAQWINPDGTIKSPEQVANDIATTLKGSSGVGDAGNLALQQFGAQNETAEQLRTDARRIGNTRNDIAVGETDPYKVASQSGIAYTPAELKAIESAYAGVYDPALDSALSKVESKQQSDAAAATAAAKGDEGFTLGKDQVRYDSRGNPIAVGISSNDGSGSGTYVPGANPTVDAYVKGSKDGTYKPSDIPDEYKSLVAQGVAQQKTPLSKASNNAISNINELLGSSILDRVTGLSLQHPSSLFPGTDVQPLMNIAKQLKGILSLENRTQLKGSGAISDFEFRVLGDAASALGIDDNGRTNLSTADFKNQLNKLKLKLEVGDTSLTDDELLYLQSKGYTPDQIREAGGQQSFSSVGNTTASTGQGNRPQRNNNPGNVKAGGLADTLAVGHDEQGHLIFPDAATGFKALTMDLTAKINGASRHLPANPTIAQLGAVYAEDPNWPNKVAQMLGVPVTTHTQAVPLDKLIKAVATQEGFYA